MPPLEQADFIHTAVVWKFIGLNRSNEPILDAPIQLPCRWDRVKRLGTDERGEPIEIMVEAAFPCYLPPRSVAWKGCLNDWEDVEGQELVELVVVDHADSLHGKIPRYEYAFARWRGTLPVNTPED